MDGKYLTRQFNHIDQRVPYTEDEYLYIFYNYVIEVGQTKKNMASKRTF